MTARRLALVLTVLSLLAPAGARAALSLAPVGSFDTPDYATAPPGDGQRLFVVERGGTIRVVRDGTILPTPFLDISSQVSGIGEGGLLSMAFAPDYRTSGLFYVYFARNNGADGSCGATASCPPIRIAEYRRSATDPDRADPASGRTVLEIPHPSATNHYGGQLQFGPEGYLYLAPGDGGTGGANARDLGSLLGKVLRIYPRRSGSSPYTVPATNPFVGQAGRRPEIWSYGLRNPFRFSFDRATGALTIGDVGQGAWEEVDVQSQPNAGRGLDFGWNLCEGTHAYPGPGSCGTGTLPWFEYPHAAGSCGSGSGTVIGGYVVRDPALESLTGRYVYGDYCQGFLHSIALPPGPPGDSDTGIAVPSLVGFGQDACARLYVVQITGQVSRLEDSTPGTCPLRVSYPPPGTGGGGTTADRRAPRVSIRVRRRERALRKGGILVRVRCDEPCSVRALARTDLRRRGRKLGLRQARARLAANASRRLRLRLTRTSAAALRRALRRHARVHARVIVRARDAAGNLSRRTVLIRLVG